MVPPDVPPVAPTPATPEPLRLVGKVRSPDGQPAAGARLALVKSAEPSAECTLVEAGPDGAFQVELTGSLPVFITAWSDAAVSKPIAVTGREGPLEIALAPGTRLTGSLQAEAGLDPNGRRTMAVWGDVGRTVSTPVVNGSFALTIPADRSVELHPFRQGTSTFEWVPPAPPGLGSGHREPLRLRAAPAYLLLIRLHEAGRTVERQPRLIAAWRDGGGPVRHLSPVPGVPGTYHTSLPPGSFRVLVWVPGYREVLHEITVAELLLFPVALEASPDSLQGFLAIHGPAASWPEFVTVRREPALLPDAPGMRVPIVRENGRARFQVEQVPWPRVVVEVGSPLAMRSEPIALPRAGLELIAHFDAAVQGVIRDASGRPLPGVLLTAQAARGSRHTQSDAEGRDRIDRLPAGPILVYPQTLATRWELAPLARNDFRIPLAPNATSEKDFVLPGAAPVRVRMRDEDGRSVQGTVMVRTPGGVLVQAREAAPGDPDPARDALPLLLPPVVPGTYRLDVSESAVLYPLGAFQLPGDVDLTVRRRQGRLVLEPVWHAGAQPEKAPLNITVQRRHGAACCRLELPFLEALEIGGLEAGSYEVEATCGSRVARGLATIGHPGSPATHLALTFR